MLDKKLDFSEKKSSFSQKQEKFKKISRKEDEELDFGDVISNEETRAFLNELRENCNGLDYLNFQRFFCVLMEEMSLSFDQEEEKEMFLAIEEALAEALTIEEKSRVSLNALEIFTKETGLRESVLNLIEKLKSTIKVKRSEEINRIAFEEINLIKDLLEERNKELNEKEAKIRECEKDLNEREEKIAEILAKFEQECEKKLEEAFKEQTSQLNKRFNVIEKNLKAKQKLLESKSKEIKSQTVQESAKKFDEKLKAKIQVLEKNNEFLKLKVVDLEKKIALEKENSQNLSNKMSRISLKSSNQEKLIKELQKSSRSETSIPSEVVQNTSQSMVSKQLETQESSEIQEESVEKKEKPKLGIKKNSDETNVMLSLLTNISNCLKHTLPVLLQNENSTSGEVETFDIGSVFYPNFNKIVSDLIEISPILNKKFEIKAIHNFVDFFYKMVNFAFRFKNNQLNTSNISSIRLESSSNRVKELQDHVNEIMLSSKSGNFELIFTPQSEFWKKILKKPASVKFSLFEKKKNDLAQIKACFQIFSNDLVQNQLLTIFKKYLDDTNQCLNSKKKSTLQSEFEIPVKNSLETQKFIAMTRIKVSLLICLFSNHIEEINQALGCLLQNIDNENEAMNDYIKKNLVEIDAINIVFSLLSSIKMKPDAVGLIIDFLLNMSSNGEHYKGFMFEMGEEKRIDVNFMF